MAHPLFTPGSSFGLAARWAWACCQPFISTSTGAGMMLSILSITEWMNLRAVRGILPTRTQLDHFGALTNLPKNGMTSSSCENLPAKMIPIISNSSSSHWKWYPSQRPCSFAWLVYIVTITKSSGEHTTHRDSKDLPLIWAPKLPASRSPKKSLALIDGVLIFFPSALGICIRHF